MLNSQEIESYLETYSLTFDGYNHRYEYLHVDGNEVIVHVFSPGHFEESVLLVHGYLDHSAYMKAAMDCLVKLGKQIITFDLPGHGLSSGDRYDIPSMDVYTDCVEKILDSNIVSKDIKMSFVGHSTGCLPGMELAKRYVVPFDKIILMAPLVRPVGWLLMSIGVSLLGNFINYIPRTITPSSSSLEFKEFRKNDPLQYEVLSVSWLAALQRWLSRFEQESGSDFPLIVFQPQKDTTLDVDYNTQFLKEKFPNLKLISDPEAQHHLLNESTKITGRIIEQFEGLFL